MGLLVNTVRTEEKMNETHIREHIEGLRHMTVGQLKDKYREAFGETSRSNHKQFLFRRIAWRLQANAWGGLSERARRRALEIANDQYRSGTVSYLNVVTAQTFSLAAERNVLDARTRALLATNQLLVFFGPPAHGDGDSRCTTPPTPIAMPCSSRSGESRNTSFRMRWTIRSG